MLVQDLHGAIQASRALKVYVCNIATQTGETDIYTCYDHVQALEEHVGENLFNIVLCNDRYVGNLSAGSQFVICDEKSLDDLRTHCADLTDESQPWRHDSTKLAATLMGILDEYTGPLD
jgi:uncharacterized cofD-like protein